MAFVEWLAALPLAVWQQPRRRPGRWRWGAGLRLAAVAARLSGALAPVSCLMLPLVLVEPARPARANCA
jgi:hypothetical protein